MSFLKITFFITKGISSSGIRQNMVNKANVLLKPHRLQLDIFPFGLETPVEVDFDETLPETGWREPPLPSNTAGIDARKRLRKAAHTAYPAADSRLKVIFCKIKGGHAEAPGALKQPRGEYGPYVLIGEGPHRSDGLTLIHEIGHCAGLEHEEYDDANFMSYGLSRSTISTTQVEALRSASFHSAAPSK